MLTIPPGHYSIGGYPWTLPDGETVRAAIRGQVVFDTYLAALNVDRDIRIRGKHLVIENIVFQSSDPAPRWHDTPGSHIETGYHRGAVRAHGEEIVFRNCVFRYLMHGLKLTGKGNGVFGCTFYENGWKTTGDGNRFGHGLYMSNTEVACYISGNLFLENDGYAINAWSEWPTSPIDHIDISSNHLIANYRSIVVDRPSQPESVVECNVIDNVIVGNESMALNPKVVHEGNVFL